MIIDARSIPKDQTIETDVCVVGAGTSGIILAKEFIGKSFRVCLLESGGLEPDKLTQSLCGGKNIGEPYFSLETARARYFGGSSNRWQVQLDDKNLGARMRELDPIDFEERPWVPYSGWPFKKSELLSYYHKAQSICKIMPTSFDVEDWTDLNKTPQFNFKGNRVKTIIYKFGSRDPFINEYPEQVLKADNIKTYVHANVVEINTDENTKTVKRLRVATLNGGHFCVSAKKFILAAGGLEIPRLLLLSNKTMNMGLGNQNDLVGRFFMEHLHWWSGFYIPNRPEIISQTDLYNKIHKVHGVPILGKISISEETQRKEKMLNYSLQLLPRVLLKTSIYPAFFPKPSSQGVASLKNLYSLISKGQIPRGVSDDVRNIIKDAKGITFAPYRRLKRNIIKNFNKQKTNVYQLAHMTEQAPNPESRVTLNDTRDALGQRRIKLNWQLSPIDIISSVKAQKIIDEELSSAGLGYLFIQMKDESPPPYLNGGWHHMGTTRMHIEPKKGVVDENCKVHGISNLYIAGPSVIPTGGHANPVLTIVALTVRLAEHLMHEFS